MSEPAKRKLTSFREYHEAVSNAETEAAEFIWATFFPHALHEEVIPQLHSGSATWPTALQAVTEYILSRREGKL